MLTNPPPTSEPRTESVAERLGYIDHPADIAARARMASSNAYAVELFEIHVRHALTLTALPESYRLACIKAALDILDERRESPFGGAT